MTEKSKWETESPIMFADNGTMTQNEEIIRRLQFPKGPVDVVLDTDTFNEIDDQFALAYLIRSKEKLNLKAIFAAPFHNEKSANAGDGMEKSYNEILNILTLMQETAMKEKVYRGSTSFLKDETTPVISDAANTLIALSKGYSKDKPLYVIAIGAITNVASALIMDPTLKDRIVLVWLGGNAIDWPHNCEFNLTQDIAAARVCFDSVTPMVLLPCMGVVSSFRTSGPELEYHLRGKNKLCDYLVDVTSKEAIACGGNSCWTRTIWDVTTIGWFLDESFMKSRFETAPIPEYDHYWARSAKRHMICYVYEIDRDKLFEDLFKKLAK